MHLLSYSRRRLIGAAAIACAAALVPVDALAAAASPAAPAVADRPKAASAVVQSASRTRVIAPDEDRLLTAPSSFLHGTPSVR